MAEAVPAGEELESYAICQKRSPGGFTEFVFRGEDLRLTSSPSPRFRLRNCQTRENDGFPIGKLGDDRELASNSFDVRTQRRQKKVGPSLHAGDAILTNSERLGDARLRLLLRSAKLAQRHLLGDQLTRPRIDSLAPSGRQFFFDSFQIGRSHFLNLQFRV